ncbi:MAG: alpha/beta hydrolase [Acidobacteriia bacterium]|nr:alpha/beta hydrolase [Terriglobia bacterium]
MPRFSRKPGVPQTPNRLRAQAPVPRLPATASHDIIWTTCPPEAEALDSAVSCGYVPVPLDRKHPQQEKINIYFELYPHQNPGPAESAILFNIGGPGSTTTGLRFGWVPIFWGNIDAHDLLLVDDRGRGLSGTIDCPELDQITSTHFINANDTALWDPAVADCAAKLGDAAGRYGTGEVGRDTEAVRAALGYDKVDYVGVSYGGVDVTAYATRFGEHLRSIVLDAPVGTPRLKQFAAEHYSARAEPRMVRLICLRSPTCSADHSSPDAALDRLIKSIRLDPVEGDAYDANGNLRHVRIDEASLLYYVIDNPTGYFTSTGELLAAAASLKQGDPVPLLRLGAEGSFRVVGEDATNFSEGDARAVLCIDTNQPWKWSEPVSEREVQYEEAVEELPSNYFAPFSKPAATGLLFSLYSRRCLWWERPTPSSPVAPPHATYPSAPTLVLTGDIDAVVPLEETTKVAALFPNSTFLTLAGVGHAGIEWSQCARKLESQFLETLEPGDVSCARTPEIVWPAVGRFPLLAKNARAAAVDPDGNNQIGQAERKVVTVAVATATDAVQRSIIGFGDGVGLRAGTFHTNYGDGSVWTTTLTNSAFSKDVTVNGTVTWNYGGALVADLFVGGSGTASGSLHVEGTWEAPGPVGNFKVTGILGGKQVAVLVPEA